MCRNQHHRAVTRPDRPLEIGDPEFPGEARLETFRETSDSDGRSGPATDGEDRLFALQWYEWTADSHQTRNL